MTEDGQTAKMVLPIAGRETSSERPYYNFIIQQGEHRFNRRIFQSQHRSNLKPVTSIFDPIKKRN